MAKTSEMLEVTTTSLIPYERNAKKHPQDQLEKLKKSIQEFGFISPCLIDRDLRIIAGHGRVEAAKQLGMETVPCVFIEGLTEEQRRAYIIADNRLTELGGWDEETVSAELQELGDAGFDISITGFDWDAISEVEAIDDDFDAESIEAEEPKTKLGDIYLLGDHRLMCGDSTDRTALFSLLWDGKAKADIFITDPPYNVDYTGKTKEALKIQNDRQDHEQFVAFLSEAFTNAAESMKDGAPFYIWHPDMNRAEFLQATENAGLTIRQVLVWAKNVMTLGHQDYQWRHEPCLYGWKDGPHYYIDDRRQTTVFEDQRPDLDKMKKEEMRDLLRKIYDEGISTTVLREKKPAVSALHPTMKPVPLIARLIKNSSRRGDIILDSFGGSGTTLIAAEQLGRRCAIMELDPHYCDVIIERWERFTGGKAVRVNG